MAIKIIDESPEENIYLTGAEHAKLFEEYNNTFMFYAGNPPSFESWVRAKGVTGKTLLI